MLAKESSVLANIWANHPIFRWPNRLTQPFSYVDDDVSAHGDTSVGVLASHWGYDEDGDAFGLSEGNGLAAVD